MDHGRVIEEGNHETLIRRPGGVSPPVRAPGAGADQGMSLRSCAMTRRASSTNPRQRPGAGSALSRVAPAAGAYRGRYQAGCSANVRQAEADQRGAKDQARSSAPSAGRQPAPHRTARQRAQHIERQPSRLTRITPSTANCRPTGPLAGDTNCGSSTEQNSKALGLSTLVSTPDISAPRQLVVRGVGRAAGLVGHGTGAQQLHPQPHQIAATRQPGRVEGPGMRGTARPAPAPPA